MTSLAQSILTEMDEDIILLMRENKLLSEEEAKKIATYNLRIKYNDGKVQEEI